MVLPTLRSIWRTHLLKRLIPRITRLSKTEVSDVKNHLQANYSKGRAPKEVTYYEIYISADPKVIGAVAVEFSRNTGITVQAARERLLEGPQLIRDEFDQSTINYIKSSFEKLGAKVELRPQIGTEWS